MSVLRWAVFIQMVLPDMCWPQLEKPLRMADETTLIDIHHQLFGTGHMAQGASI